jgi:putative salt-induced outer membrane protein YdiY/small nuclear ribonucleoprotein (snRNP)-like protein
MRFSKCGKLFLACLLVSALLPAAWADQVVLKNGDRVTGSIVKKDDKNLTVKTDHLGVIAIPWDQIESIVAEKPVNIVLQDGRTLQGTLTATSGKAEVITPQTRVSVTPADIVTIRNDDEEKAYQRLLHPGWGELWAGTGTVGFAGTAGNAKTMTFTTGINANRITNTDKTSLYFSLITATARVDNESKDTAEAARGGISYAHDVNPRLFLSVFNDYEYDRFQDLDLRLVLGGGAGFHAWKREKDSMDLLAGIAYNHSSFSTPMTRNSAEFYWGNEYALKLGSATSLVQSYRMFNDLTNTGIYRVNFDIGLSTKLLKWLSWNIALSDRFLSDPAPGRKTNDFLYTTGLGIAFAQ